MDSEDSYRVKVELQQLMSHIKNGEPELGQLRAALDEPLLEKWKLPAYQNIPTTNGCTLLSWAIQWKNPGALDLLMTNLGLKSLPEAPQTDITLEENADLLYTAVEFYHEPTWISVVQRLDAKRAFKHLGPSGNSVLHAAAKRNITGIFRTLHEQTGNTLRDKLFLKDNRGQNALHVATSQKCHTTVLELLEIQPKLIAEQDRNGETVFHKAVIANQKHILEHLLTVDANVLSKCDKNDNSAYRIFLKTMGKGNHIRDESRKGRETLSFVSRTFSLDTEIGSILDKAILDLNLTISEKRRLLFKNEHGFELLWDMSTFDKEKINFPEYLRFLELKHLNVKFHETLLRVALPNLDCTGKQRCDATTHGLRRSREANLIFRHLADNKVKHILKVVVPDCTLHPHANKDIIEALRPFTVRNLDWRKLNLGVRTIMTSAPEVETLTLYSSGDEDALAQWINFDGLCQLPKLHTICITIFRGESTDAELEKIRFRCEQALLSQKRHSEHDRTFHMVPRFDISRITVKLEPLPMPNVKVDTGLQLHQHHKRQGDILDKLSPLRDFLSMLENSKIGKRADIDYWKSQPVKVAILDSGVNADTASFPAITGASFIEDLTDDSHWHTITNPHGTIMASLVRKINPNCHIYAARTHHGPNMQGGDVNATIKALDWAMKQKADIICISWTCAKGLDENDYTNLENKISEVGGKSLIFCATGDNGPSAEESFPAAFPSPFSICSCSVSGIPSASAETNHAEFLVPAEELCVDIPQYLNQGGKESADGSSAATAVAAGLAALVISLARFAFYSVEDITSESEDDISGSEDDYLDRMIDKDDTLRLRRVISRQTQKLEDTVSRLKTRTVMKRVFKHMCFGSDKFVQPWKVFPTDLGFEPLDAAKKRIADFLNAAKTRG